MPARKAASKDSDTTEPAIAAPNVSDRFPVVGIGASAGGLEAATFFLRSSRRISAWPMSWYSIWILPEKAK